MINMFSIQKRDLIVFDCRKLHLVILKLMKVLNIYKNIMILKRSYFGNIYVPPLFVEAFCDIKIYDYFIDECFFYNISAGLTKGNNF